MTSANKCIGNLAGRILCSYLFVHCWLQFQQTNITDEKIEFLRNFVKPLLRTISNVDFKAMRFEKDIVEVSLAHLSNEKPKFETLKDSIIEEIGELPLSVNIVAREEAIIRQAQRKQNFRNEFIRWSTAIFEFRAN